MFLDNATPDFLFIRPIVNPIDTEGFQKMWTSLDLVLESGDINKTQKSELLVSDTAMCVFSLGSDLLIKEVKTTISPTVTSSF